MGAYMLCSLSCHKFTFEKGELFLPLHSFAFFYAGVIDIFIMNWFLADPVIHIPEETISANVGDEVVIRAAVYSSSSDIVVMWYHEDSLIGPDNDTYVIGSQGRYIYNLTISTVVETLMGRYMSVVITHGGNSSDSVQLLEGKCICGSCCLDWHLQQQGSIKGFFGQEGMQCMHKLHAILA